MTQPSESPRHKVYRAPPWRRWPPNWGGDPAPPWVGRWSGEWHRKRRFLFLRFVSFFVGFMVLVAGGMAVLAFLLTRWFGGGGHTIFLVWLGGCGLALLLPLGALGIALYAFRRYATPIANIMAAADAVAEGDLNVRVPEEGPGEFRHLARSFNRMTSELAQTDQQRRNLTADVAHELRTPLHIIQGNLEGLLDGVYAPTPEQFGATLDETRKLARLVEDLRTLSLAESGQLALARQPVDMYELLADVVTTFSPQAEAQGITLQAAAGNPPRAAHTEPLTVQGDAGRLDQVLSNLVVNALRHTPPGGQVTLQAERQAERLRIVVADTGVGIAPEDLPFIFDRFWKGERARTHHAGTGSGLGLAIARQLIHAHGGQINAQSTPGHGATFVIELPLGQ